MSTIRARPGETVQPQTDEVYARSLGTLERVGALAVAGALERDADGAVQLLRDDFDTGVLENLRTAPGIEARLDIERVRWQRVVDGQAVAADGTPMVDIITRGYDAARAAGKRDGRMNLQAYRDQGDLLVAEAADALQPGQLLMAVSLPPLDGLAADPKFWGDLGYRPDLAYVQTYYKNESGQAMVAGSYSVGGCDMAAWRRTLRDFGVAIPGHTSADDFIRHFAVLNVSSLEALQVGQRVRERYYHEIGERHRRQSVTDYLALQQGVVDQYFNRYLLPLAEAVHTGQNPQPLQEFAQAILESPAASQFNPEVAREVMRVANSAAFPRSAGAVMENLIRYALVERLRQGLVDIVHGAAPGAVRIDISHDVPYELLHRLLANDVATGIQAGRNYGGCASLVLGSESYEVAANPQEAYGGRSADSKDHWKWKTGICRVKNCPSPSPTEVGPCSVCRRCQRLFDLGRDPTKQSRESAAQRSDTADDWLAAVRGKQTAKGKDRPPKRNTTPQRAGRLLLAA